MKISKTFISTLIIVCSSFNASARDINLDEIYIKKESQFNKRLIENKMDVYQKISAVLVDRGISFAWWISGSEIIYIKENQALNANIIYRYNIFKQKSDELYRFPGAITSGRAGRNGNFIILKRLILTDNYLPVGQTLIYDTASGEMTVNSSPNAFLDFSISDAGNSIIYENGKNIIEYFLDSGTSSLLVGRSNYSDIIVSQNPSMALLSPDRNKFIIINGSGGYYKCKLFDKGQSYKIEGVTSASEIYWIDSTRIVLRKGSSGNFSVVLYHINNKNEKILLGSSFNTNIIYSPHSMMISFLKEQIINIYSVRENKLTCTGIEGEDVFFAPNGTKFIALLYKKLFIVDTLTLNRRLIDLKRSWREILSVYKELKSQKGDLLNEYSLYYINRKIDAYNQLAGD